jgi:RimJ/RimL family protein N-acetyltransferase
LKCQRVTSFVRKGNKRARRLNDGLGFKLEGRLRDAGHNLETVLVYGLTQRDYVAKYITPFLRRKPIGQQETAGATART